MRLRCEDEEGRECARALIPGKSGLLWASVGVVLVGLSVGRLMGGSMEVYEAMEEVCDCGVYGPEVISGSNAVVEYER